MQIHAIQMNAAMGTQAYAVALNALDIPVGNEDAAAHPLWQSSQHGIGDHLFDTPGANRNKTPLSSKAPPFISTTVQDRWRPSLPDILPSHAVEQLKVSGSEDIVAPSVSRCWNMHDKVLPPRAGPPGDLSLPVKGRRLAAHQEEQECHRGDAIWDCHMPRWRHNLYDPGSWATSPKTISPPLSRESTGEIHFEPAFEDPLMCRGRHTERQPHSYSCVSRTPSPPAVCHVHPLAIDSIIKLPEMPFQPLRMQPPEEGLKHFLEEWPQERLVEQPHKEEWPEERLAEQPVKHTFIHYSTSSLEESGDEDTESSGGSTTASERTLNRSSTAPSLMMLNPVFQTKSQDAAKKSTGLSEMQLLHAKKQCTPCAYFHHKADGCRMGDDCQFCHFCPANATKSKKKDKYKEIRLKLLRLQSARKAAKAGKGKNARPNWADMSS